MLDANIKQQLQAHFDKLTQKVEITAYLDDTDKSGEMRELLKDLAALSSNISLTEQRDAAERTPSFKLSRPGEETGIQFAGIPLGHEFTSLVLALLQVGGHPPRADADTLEQIRALDGTYHFETYISLSCQNCPEVVQALNLLALYNPNITHVMIDGALFQEEVSEKQIMAVPTIFMNGAEFGQGRMNLEQILARLDTGTVAREAEKSMRVSRLTFWWSAVARLAAQRRFMPPVRVYAPALSRSGLVARCWIPTPSKTSFLSRKPKGRSWLRRWKSTCAAMTWTS